MRNLLQELQETLLHEIPITQHLGITVESYNNGLLILTAPLAENINHKQTAFAGSLNSLVTLAGWSQLWLVLKELNLTGNIVIQDSSTSYLLPVNANLCAYCRKPEIAQITKLEKTLKKKGKARLELRAEIHTEQAVAVVFTGRYVIYLVENKASILDIALTRSGLNESTGLSAV